MNDTSCLQALIKATADALANYLLSRTVLDRELYRLHYMSLGEIVLDQSQPREIRQIALNGMGRLGHRLM